VAHGWNDLRYLGGDVHEEELIMSGDVLQLEQRSGQPCFMTGQALGNYINSNEKLVKQGDTVFSHMLVPRNVLKLPGEDFISKMRHPKRCD
jgi:hypothetical protein